MTGPISKILVLSIMAVAAAGLHFLHDYTVSFFIFPVVIAAILPYTYQPIWLTGGVILAMETLSGMPPGVMALVVLAPWLMRKVFSAIAVDLSGKFLLLILATVGVQLSILFAGAALQQSLLPWDIAWRHIPVRLVLQSLLSSSMLVYVLVIVWDEIFSRAPYRR